MVKTAQRVSVGTRVRAVFAVTEEGFRGPGTWIHARPGDLGTVVDVFPGGGLMVRWDASGTAADCPADGATVEP